MRAMSLGLIKGVIDEVDQVYSNLFIIMYIFIYQIHTTQPSYNNLTTSPYQNQPNRRSKSRECSAASSPSHRSPRWPRSSKGGPKRCRRLVYVEEQTPELFN